MSTESTSGFLFPLLRCLLGGLGFQFFVSYLSFHVLGLWLRLLPFVCLCWKVNGFPFFCKKKTARPLSHLLSFPTISLGDPRSPTS